MSIESGTRILSVPYFVQPTSLTCQATCIKMMAAYLEDYICQPAVASARNILDIWTDINTSPDRPLKVRDAHANLTWWLARHFPSLQVEYLTLYDEERVVSKIVEYIDSDMPVLMGVSPAEVEGHVVLAIGYQDHLPGKADTKLVVHDPYRRFDPQIRARAYGSPRDATSGEPGQRRSLTLDAVSRRQSDTCRRLYGLLSARR